MKDKNPVIYFGGKLLLVLALYVKRIKTAVAELVHIGVGAFVGYNVGIGYHLIYLLIKGILSVKFLLKAYFRKNSAERYAEQTKIEKFHTPSITY